jgi:hypothetical protein
LADACMKGVTFAIAFILTIVLVIGGTLLYPNILGQAATQGNDFVFGFFLIPFFVLLFFCWLGEKLVLKVFKK